jgi:hypothetical protein
MVLVMQAAYEVDFPVSPATAARSVAKLVRNEVFVFMIVSLVQT